MEAKNLLIGEEGMHQETLRTFKEDLVAHGGDPLKITEARVDMSPGFIKGLADHFPNEGVTACTSPHLFAQVKLGAGTACHRHPRAQEGNEA